MPLDPILSDLQYVLETNQELDILNFHKSFPITCKARVENINGAIVTLKVQPPGSVCLQQQEHTLVLSRGLPEAVRARILEFDLVSGKLKLTDLDYVGAHFGDRMIARVSPEGNMPVEIATTEQTYNGQLVDVSLSGVGIHVTEDVFRQGMVIQMTLPLPEGRITLPGKILTISNTAGQKRLSISFTRNAQEISLIMRYVKDRRMEILSEIDELYQQAYHKQTA